MNHRTQSAFSLLEVIFSLGILILLSVSLTTLMRSSFDIREGISQNARASHRLASAMSKIVNDLEHAYIVSEKEVLRTGNIDLRNLKTTFEVETGTAGDSLRLTTLSHTPLVKNAQESDATFVVYRLQEDSSNGRTRLMRGEAKRKPDDFRDDPELQVLAEHIKSFKVTPWRGDDWMKDKWDSNRSDTRGMLPKMVKVEIEAFQEDDPERDEGGFKVSTIVQLPMAIMMNEPRSTTSTIKWEKM